MFKLKSKNLLKERDGILAQFLKSIEGLKKVNEKIFIAQEECTSRVSELALKLKDEENEMKDLTNQTEMNNKTIKKMEEFFN